MITFKLNENNWDLEMTESGQIAIRKGDLALAQTVANAQRIFKGEAYFNVNRGIPFAPEVLSGRPSESLVIGYLEREARNVDGVQGANVYLETFENRIVTGRTQIIKSDGGVIDADTSA